MLEVVFGGVCGAVAVDESITLTLREPLGSRKVYDAACLGDRAEREQCLRRERE